MLESKDDILLFLAALTMLIKIYEEDTDSVPIIKLKTLLEHYDLQD